MAKVDHKIIEAELSRILAEMGSQPAGKETASSRRRSSDDDFAFIRNFKLRPNELSELLAKTVIGQKRAIRVLASKICGHYSVVRHRLEQGDDPMADVNRIKSNILLIGTTGVGKTLLLKLIAKHLGVPFIRVDATKYTEAGYVGKDVEDIIRDLVKKTKNSEGRINVPLAQYGIVFIDEVDKLASSPGVSHDVSRRGVQQALLTLVEDTTVSLEDEHNPIQMMDKMTRLQRGERLPPSKISTKNMLFIFSGAFPGLEEIIASRMHKQKIGFGAETTAPRADKHESLKDLRTEDLIKFGMEAELIGRIPVRVAMERLSEEDLYLILKNEESPIVGHFREVMASFGTDVAIDDDVLRFIAAKAAQEQTGARGLVSAFESTIGVFEAQLADLRIPKFRFTLPMVDGQIEPNEFMEALAAKVSGRMARHEDTAKDDGSIASYVSQVKELYGLDITFDKAASAAIMRLTHEQSSTSLQVCQQVFQGISHVLAQLNAVGIKKLVFTEDAVKNPSAFIEKVVR